MLEINKLYLGDCLEVMRSIESGSIDMILCDLPYGTTACKWDSVIPFEPLWEQYKRIIKPNGAIVLTASQPFTSALVLSNIQWFKYQWVWEKTNLTGFANAKKQPLRAIEDILIFYKNQSIYNPQGLKKLNKPRKRTKKTGDFMGKTGFKDGYQQTVTGYPKNILTFSSECGLHPTQKPVALFEYLIKTYTNEGDLVLDNCIGSGTTAIAAINTNRKWLGIEKDHTYFEIAQKRIADFVYKLNTN